MKKSKSLGILLGVLAVLLVLYFVVNTVSKKEEIPPEKTEEVTYDILHVDNNTVTHIEYTFDNITYAYTLKSDATGWLYDADVELPLYNAPFVSMVSAVMSLQSTTRIENVSEERLASDYGIGVPGAISARFVDGTYGDQTLLFGKTNAYNGKVYVVKAADKSTVYMVGAEIPQSFMVLPADMVMDDELPVVTKTKLRAVRIGDGDGAVLFSRKIASSEEETDEWTRIVGGGNGEVLEGETGENLLNGITSLKLSDAVSFHVADRESYGLGETPVSILTVYYSFTNEVKDETTGATTSTELETSYRLLLGNRTEDGQVYVRTEDGAGIYLVKLPDILAYGE